LPNDSTYLEQDITYFDPLLNNSASSWSATSGCLIQSTDNNGDGSWNGTSGGQCANIGINGDGAIRFGWTAATISQTQDVISDALRSVGIDVVGYLYQWKVKNYNGNDTSTNQTCCQDPLTVTITFKDTAGNELYSREYDYSYSIANWTQKNGQQLFPQAFGTDATGVDTITIEVYGQDAGYWAGYWGPEFREGQVYGLYVYRPPEEDNSCDLDPLSDPTCPGYADALAAEQDALLELIASSNTADPAGTTDDQAFLQSVQETSTASLDDGSGALEEITSEPIIETQTQTVEPIQTQESTQVAVATDPAPVETVAEEAAIEEAIEEVAVLEEVAVVEETAVEEATEEATEEVAQEESSASNAPSANPLSVAAAAVAAADNVASAASSGAVANSQASVAAAEQTSADIQSDIAAADAVNVEQTATATAVVAGSTEVGSAASTTSTAVGASSDTTTNTGSSTTGSSETSVAGTGSTGSQNFGSQSMSGSDDGSGSSASQALAMGTVDTSVTTDAQTNTGLPSSFGEPGAMNVVISSTPGQSNDPGDTGGFAIELVVDSNFDIAAVDSAINLALARVQDLESSIVENAIEESTESFEDQNAKEDALVAEALAGTDNEDANAALMGYNPNFRAYQSDGLADGAFYAPKEIYEGQQNYDNPNARLFNGASDQLHRDMVRQQYEK